MHRWMEHHHDSPHLLSPLSHEDVTAQDRFLLCNVWLHSPVIRDTTGPYGKWAVAAGEVGEEETEYPPYCSGWLYITSPDTARNLALQVHLVACLLSDDELLAGGAGGEGVLD